MSDFTLVGRCLCTRSTSALPQSRLRNSRVNWTVTLNEPVSGNYYPVNCLMRELNKDDPLFSSHSAVPFHTRPLTTL